MAMIDFVAHWSRRCLAGLLVLVAIAVGACLWVAGALGEFPDVAEGYRAAYRIAIGWTAVVVTVLAGILIARRLFDGREQLRIGRSGIHWRPWSDQTIPWSEITNVTTWQYKGQGTEMIILHLRNPDRFPARGLLATLLGRSRMLTGGDMAIALSGTDRSSSEALAAIEWFRSRGGRERSVR